MEDGFKVLLAPSFLANGGFLFFLATQDNVKTKKHAKGENSTESHQGNYGLAPRKMENTKRREEYLDSLSNKNLVLPFHILK